MEAHRPWSCGTPAPSSIPSTYPYGCASVCVCVCSGFPPTPLTMCPWFHLAPRSMLIRSASARPARSGCSVLAGCTSSTSYAGGYRYRAAREIQRAYFRVGTVPHVDNIPQIATGPTEAGVVANLVAAAERMRDGPFPARHERRQSRGRRTHPLGVVAAGAAKRSTSIWEDHLSAVREKTPAVDRHARARRRARQLWATNAPPLQPRMASARMGSPPAWLDDSVLTRLPPWALRGFARAGLPQSRGTPNTPTRGCGPPPNRSPGG